jgi:HD-GYP domain-containing protein (c-di-GMP phosphodiesterase class II)
LNSTAFKGSFRRLKPFKYRIKATNEVLTEGELRHFVEENGLFKRTSERISDKANSSDYDIYSLCSAEYESDEESTTHHPLNNVSSSEFFSTTTSEIFNNTEEEIANAFRNIPLPQKYQYNDQVNSFANEMSTEKQGYMIIKKLVIEEGVFNNVKPFQCYLLFMIYRVQLGKK